MTTSQTAIVITCYELGETLPEAVASALAQTAAPAELVVVDDGSQDALTKNVIDQLADNEPRVTVMRSVHRGVAHARNLGIGSTTAPHVVLLDGDDVFEPTYIEKAEEVLRERSDLSFVCCALRAFGRASYKWKPPPYTYADAVGRGACGHISTVFRRQVWNAVGGFDVALPAYEDVDFWLRALDLGYRGVILDEALVRYRVRHGSRYQSTVVSGDYLRAKEMLLTKHSESARPRGEDILVALLEFRRELVRQGQTLDSRAAALRRSVRAADHEVAAVTDELAARELRGFDWGRLDLPLDPDYPPGHDPVERHYAELAQHEFAANALERTLLVRARPDWPAGGSPRYDQIVIAGALEYEPDPGEALTRCRNALRPGGSLLVTAAASALGAGRLVGLTERSLRALMCEIFPPGHVTARGYGNVLACVASTAGLPPSELTEQELALVDSAHPVIVAASASVPRTSRLRGGRAERGHTPQLPPQHRVGSRAVILCYHRIASLHPDTQSRCVPPDLFSAQMELIAKSYRPQPLADLVAQASTGDLADRAIAVTFDDGYIDNLEVASPILEEFGVPATFFVSGTASEHPAEGWWDTMERIFVGDEQIPERLTLEIGDGRVALDTRTQRQRRAALLSLHRHLMDAEPDRIAELVRVIASWSGMELPVRGTHRLMTASEIGELDERPGHTIGAHGLNSLRLPTHAPEVQAAEIGESRSRLEELLGKPVTMLAYAYGSCDLQTTEIAAEAGFTAACTVEGGAVTRYSDPLRLPRVDVRGGSVEEFELQLERLITDAT